MSDRLFKLRNVLGTRIHYEKTSNVSRLESDTFELLEEGSDLPRPPPLSKPDEIEQARSLKTTLRALSFQIIDSLSTSFGRVKAGTAEQPKIAIQKSRLVALLRSSVHILPLWGSLILIVLNFTNFYVGRADWLSVLQFVAKSHELLMQTSIAASAMTYLRYELLSENGIPFGALFPALQVTFLSSLWSMEFWASANSFGGRRQAVFLIFVPLCVLLAAGVGPSSAIAMIPRPVDYAVAEGVGTIPWDSYHNIFPAQLTADLLDPRCANVSWIEDPLSNCLATESHFLITYLKEFENDSSEIDSNVVDLPAKHATRTFSIQSGYHEAVVTTQSYLIARSVSDAASYWNSSKIPIKDPRFGKQVIVSARAPQPRVQAKCERFFANSADTALISVGDSQLENVTFEDVAHLNDQFPQGRLIWLDPPSQTQNTYSIVALVLIPNNGTANNNEDKSNNNDDGYHLTYPKGGRAAVCTIEASWITANLRLGSTLDSLEGSISSEFANIKEQGSSIIPIAPAWAASAMPTMKMLENTSVVELLGPPAHDIYLSCYDTSQTAGFCTKPRLIDHTTYYERMLASFIAAGMARGSEVGDNVYEDKWRFDFTSFRVATWTGSPVYTGNLDENAFKLKMTFSFRGLAYTLDGVPARIAIAILILYSLFAVVSILHALKTGISSTAWDSVAEITALALNSERPMIISNTSAGIERMSTFRHTISVRSKTGQGLQIVFEADKNQTRSEESNEEAPFKAVGINKTY